MSKRKIILLVLSACVIVVFALLFRSAVNHPQTLRLGSHFGIAANAPEDAYSGCVDIVIAKSFWNRFITLENIEFHDHYYGLKWAWLTDKYIGLYAPDDLDVEQLNLQPVECAKLHGGDNHFLLELERDNPPPSEKPLKCTHIIVLNYKYFGIRHTFVCKYD